MRGAAEDLQREGLIHRPATLFQKMSVFRFRIRDPPEGRAEADSNSSLRLLPRPTESRVLEREFRRTDRELRIAVEPLQAMRREEILRLPVPNFRGL